MAGFFLPAKKWQILAIPGGGVISTASTIPTVAKYAITAAAGAAAGVVLFGAKQSLEQQQKATAQAPTYYQFYQTPGGGEQNIFEPSGGTASTEQKQEGEQSTSDYMQILILGALGLGALYVLTGRKK